ncbi:MAG: DUF4830 domain-containing protein [Clostridiales bacterium]|nr:DUF4830 domain-containing protein [Clostridiales bacterium]
MYIKSIKVNQRLVKIVLFLLLAAVLALLLMRVMSGRPTDAMAINRLEVDARKIKTNEDRVNFIKQFGWEVEEAAVEVSEVMVPKTFDEVYRAYNAMQLEQGLDLEKYQGKSCKRWSYRILNYPNESGEVHCNLLISGSRIIAADIAKVELGGFMHGMAMPKPTLLVPEVGEAGVDTAEQTIAEEPALG